MTAWARELAPIDTAPLFRPLLGELVGLLRALNSADWERPTVAGAWQVRDLAAHLLDGDLRKIAVYRDQHRRPLDGPLNSDRDVARFVNGLNQTGVSFGARLSPRLLTELLEITGGWVADVVEKLPLDGPSIFAVSWAGETESLNWMDTGREYTERWHHQAQIRDAIGESRLLGLQWVEPLLDISVRALPVAYGSATAEEGTAVSLEVHSPGAGAWTVIRDGSAWRVVRDRPPSPTALVRVAADDAWRLLFNAVKSPGLMERVEVVGDADLAQPLLRARAVIL